MAAACTTLCVLGTFYSKKLLPNVIIYVVLTDRKESWRGKNHIKTVQIFIYFLLFCLVSWLVLFGWAALEKSCDQSARSARLRFEHTLTHNQWMYLCRCPLFQTITCLHVIRLQALFCICWFCNLCVRLWERISTSVCPNTSTQRESMWGLFTGVRRTGIQLDTGISFFKTRLAVFEHLCNLDISVFHF